MTMETIRNFEELIDHLRLRGDRKRVAVVWAADSQTQMSVSQGLEVGFIEAVFVGCREQVEANAVLMRHREHIFFEEAADCDDAARKAVALVHRQKLMVENAPSLPRIKEKHTFVLPLLV